MAISIKEQQLPLLQSGAATADILGRSRYEVQLRGLHDTTRSPAESAFLHKWEAPLPRATWEPFIVSWLRALASYGTPASFLDSLTPKSEQFRRLGMNWSCFLAESGNYGMRRSECVGATGEPRLKGKVPFDRGPRSFAGQDRGWYSGDTQRAQGAVLEINPTL